MDFEYTKSVSILENIEAKNQEIVFSLYKALQLKDVGTAQRVLAPHLEWWFHGPPENQHLMHLLTGTASAIVKPFNFNPLSIVCFGSLVVAEGYDNDRSLVSWVHAWTISDGIITHVREYFNTSVTITLFLSSNMMSLPSSAPAKNKWQRVWQSKLSDNDSVPSLVLAL